MTVDMFIEREVKLAVWPGFRLPALTDVVSGATATPAADQHLEATYYDTPDLRLGRSGITLRYRTGEDGGDRWTLKLPSAGEGGALVRAEMSVVADAKSVPTELAELVAARVRSAALGPVARLSTVRRRIEVRCDDQVLAEVVDDEVSVLEGRRVALRFREVEVELAADGPPAVLTEIVTRLRAAGAGEPDPTPKVIRALGPAASAPPDLAELAIGRAPSAREILTAGLTRSVRRLIDHDPVVREGVDPEGVHQARVATRRLRSDLRVYQPLLDATWAGALRSELSWLADTLGRVRDVDVLMMRLQRQANELPPADAAAARELIALLGVEHAAARGELIDAYRSRRYLDLLDRLVAAVHAPLVLPAADRPARSALPALARAPWLAFEKAARKVSSTSSDDALHEVRIRAKRARYAAEVAAIAVGKRARSLADALADVQELLGEHHDAGVAADWLRRASTGVAPATAFVAGQLVGRQEAEARRHLEAWPAVWEKTRKGKLTSWLT